LYDPTMKPVWLLDFDGVLNVPTGKPRWHAAPRKVVVAPGNGGQYTLRWAPALADRVSAVHRTGLAEVRWCSTWVGYTGLLERVLGLAHFEDAYLRPEAWQPLNPHPRLKLDSALAEIDAGRPVIWTDDDAIPPYMLAEADAWLAFGVLLIAPQPNRGLTPEDMDRIEAFARSVAPSVGAPGQDAADSDHPREMSA
jgi:hypothetical protein